MTEEIRHEIVRRHQGGASIRRIAEDLDLARQTVRDVIRRWQAERPPERRCRHPDADRVRSMRTTTRSVSC